MLETHLHFEPPLLVVVFILDAQMMGVCWRTWMRGGGGVLIHQWW